MLINWFQFKGKLLYPFLRMPQDGEWEGNELIFNIIFSKDACDRFGPC